MIITPDLYLARRRSNEDFGDIGVFGVQAPQLHDQEEQAE